MESNAEEEHEDESEDSEDSDDSDDSDDSEVSEPPVPLPFADAERRPAVFNDVMKESMGFMAAYECNRYLSTGVRIDDKLIPADLAREHVASAVSFVPAPVVTSFQSISSDLLRLTMALTVPSFSYINRATGALVEVPESTFEYLMTWEVSTQGEMFPMEYTESGAPLGPSKYSKRRRYLWSQWPEPHIQVEQILDSPGNQSKLKFFSSNGSLSILRVRRDEGTGEEAHLFEIYRGMLSTTWKKDGEELLDLTEDQKADIWDLLNVDKEASTLASPALSRLYPRSGQVSFERPRKRRAERGAEVCLRCSAVASV